ncbi:SPOR domain-containing protein [Sulfurovum sp.]|uniref:SPOR domain-containing protein n=1 Tax=Sulfurovum sp. TaxID=1969726 RepID=UPI0025DFB831|nr:SPOR domain-containing protein [Sulfurovum sp.]
MNDHNLDDLIIDNMEPKNSKAKSILTIIALFIVVLIVAIILTKIILKEPKAEHFASEEDNTEMISPELTLQNTTQTKETKEETKLSTIIESEPKAPAQAPKAVEKKKETAKKEEPVKETVEITKEFAQVPTEPETKPSVEEPHKKEIEKIAEPKKEVIQVAKPAPSRIIEKAKEHPAGRPANAPKPKPVASQTYYIQVGSFRQTPSSRFLSIIKNSGFNYKITPPAANGTKKLLIGPYEDRKAVDTALVRVRDRINKSAFVVKK